MEEVSEKHKEHRKTTSARGQKAAKIRDKKAKKEWEETKASAKSTTKKLSDDVEDARKRNPKAFAIQSVKKAERKVRRKEDITEKRKHVPSVDRTPVEPPPVVVAIVGPPKVGKTTLLNGLMKNYSKQTVPNGQWIWPTVVSGKKQRLRFIECSNDVNAMIDVAKVADLVLLLVDASFGFEMEVFEFLNICQVHGMPRVMGVLTHLDHFKNQRTLRKTKKVMKHRFWTEVYAGAKLFYLSGMVHAEYQKTEVHNLGRFISVMKFRPLTWRETHPYVVADRMEDLTSPEEIRVRPKCDRSVSVYGYVRGTNLKSRSHVHIPGCGDFPIADLAFLPDPCPLPDLAKKSKRTLNEKERSVYAPMSGVGGIVYDKDAVYIDLGGSHSHKKGKREREEEKEGGALVSNIIGTEATLDEKIEQSEVRLFSGSVPLKSSEFPTEERVVDESGRVRRKAVFSSALDDAASSDEEDSDEDEDAETEGDDQSEGQLEEEEEEEDDKSDVDEQNEQEVDQGTKARKETLAEKTKRLKKEMGMSSEEDDDDDDEEDDMSDDGEQDEDTVARSSSVKPVDKAKKVASPKQSELKDTISEVLSVLGSSSKKGSKKSAERASESKSDSSDDEEEEDEEDGETPEDSGRGSEDSGESDIESGGDEADDDHDAEEEGETANNAWKEDILKRASDSYYHRLSNTTSLRKIVYGIQMRDGDDEDDKGDDEDVGGGLFKIVRRDARSGGGQANATDSTSFSSGVLRDWDSDEVRLSIRDCFVTGKWRGDEDAETLLRMDDEDLGEEEEVDGDFEDLETGEVHRAADGKAGEGDDEEEDKPRVVEEDKDARARRMEKKRKLKAMFDADYDDVDGSGGSKHYDELKKEVDQQTMLNRSEFEGMDDAVRVQYEGFRPGMYVRIEVKSVPCELVENFDPAYPLILGGLRTGEDQVGFVRIRLKKHRWYPKILKNRDPLIFSVGWRRFQSIPVFSVTEHNFRQRMIKYTPQHEMCNAHIWGPVTPQGTGVLAVQSVADVEAKFRIAATGSVMDMDKSTQVVKKLKLTGEPFKIFKKTAFIKGMFTTNLEVSKFEGAAIKTVSGIRGMIKKSVTDRERQGGGPGAFRATFEDKIVMSDIVFVKTWFAIDIPRFYAPVTNLLFPPEEKTKWRGMKTVGEIKREKRLAAVPDPDQLYRPVVRAPKIFKPLAIPRALQKELPYRLKPKFAEPGRDVEAERVSIELGSREKKVRKMMKMLTEAAEEKAGKLEAEKKRRVGALIAKQEEVERRKLRHEKVARMKVARALSQERARKEKMAAKGGGGGGRKRKRIEK